MGNNNNNSKPSNPDCSYMTKIILVGKSSILQHLTEMKINSRYIPTVAIEFYIHKIKYGNEKTIKLQIWDISGDKRFEHIIPFSLRGCRFLLLFLI